MIDSVITGELKKTLYVKLLIKCFALASAEFINSVRYGKKTFHACTSSSLYSIQRVCFHIVMISTDLYMYIELSFLNYAYYLYSPGCLFCYISRDKV